MSQSFPTNLLCTNFPLKFIWTYLIDLISHSERPHSGTRELSEVVRIPVYRKVLLPKIKDQFYDGYYCKCQECSENWIGSDIRYHRIFATIHYLVPTWSKKIPGAEKSPSLTWSSQNNNFLPVHHHIHWVLPSSLPCRNPLEGRGEEGGEGREATPPYLNNHPPFLAGRFLVSHGKQPSEASISECAFLTTSKYLFKKKVYPQRTTANQQRNYLSNISTMNINNE